MTVKIIPIITVVSAHQLIVEQKQLAASILKQRVGECQVEYVVEPAVLGGIQVKVGDQTFDASLAGQLQALSLSARKCLVTTAVPLTAIQREKLVTSVRTQFGSVPIQEVIDPQVLGGIKVMIGSTEYDQTIQGKLRSLRASTELNAHS